MKKMMTKNNALAEARRLESLWSKDFYVVRQVSGATNIEGHNYFVTDRMPYVGEWFDSAGTQHGSV